MCVDDKLSNLIAKYVTRVGQDMVFQGRDDIPEDFGATVTFAGACTSFTIDVEDEVCFEEDQTCYNCRYRSWTYDGFSCLKGFPLT